MLRNLTPAERQTLKVDKDETGACLIAVCRLQHFGDNTPNRTAMASNDNEFVARVGTNGRFTYVDPRYGVYCNWKDIAANMHMMYIVIITVNLILLK